MLFRSFVFLKTQKKDTKNSSSTMSLCSWTNAAFIKNAT